MAGEPFEELYYRSTYSRRTDLAGTLAGSIRDAASHVLFDLERDRIPRMRSLADDVLRLSRTIAELEAMAEMKKVYDSAAESAKGGK
jgi:hypothetical protein